MEPVVSLPYSQGPSTGPHPERSFILRIRPDPSHFTIFCNKRIFYGEKLSAPRPTLQLEDHPLSAVRDCFN
jgi:hypothetical protein